MMHTGEFVFRKSLFEALELAAVPGFEFTWCGHVTQPLKFFQ